MSDLGSREASQHIMELEPKPDGFPPWSSTSSTSAYLGRTQKPERQANPEKADVGNLDDLNCPTSAHMSADYDASEKKRSSWTTDREGQLKIAGPNERVADRSIIGNDSFNVWKTYTEPDVPVYKPASYQRDSSRSYLPAPAFRRGLVLGGVKSNNSYTPNPHPTYHDSYVAETSTRYPWYSLATRPMSLPKTTGRPMEPAYTAGPSQRDNEISRTALDIIASIMMNSSVNVAGEVTILEDLRRGYCGVDVPFSRLLEVPVEGYGMPPLTIETARCDFDRAPDLLLFFAEHTAALHRAEYIRRGCMARKDDLFEKLRPLWPSQRNRDTPPPFEYVVSLEQYTTPYTNVLPRTLPHNTFRALISIPNFVATLQANAAALVRSNTSRMYGPSDYLQGSSSAEVVEEVVKEASLAIELVALGRYWTLEIKRNKLVLTLMDGPDCSVDASLTIIEEEFPDLALAVQYDLDHPEGPIPDDLFRSRLTYTAPNRSVPNTTQSQTVKGVDSISSFGEDEPATRTGTTEPFFFPQARLYSHGDPKGPTHVEIPHCFPSNERPSNFLDATLVSNQLLVKLVVRIYDEQGGVAVEDHVNGMPSSVGVAGASNSFASGNMGHRSQADGSSAGAWSLIHDGDMFDSDESVSYTGKDSDHSDDDGSGLPDLGW